MNSLRVCVSLGGDMADVMARLASAAKVGADMAELRLDLIPGFNLEALLAPRRMPVIVTYRPKREGGAYDGPEEERLALLRRAGSLGADYIDIEADAVTSFGDHGCAKLIVSHHEFSGKRKRPLSTELAALESLPGDIVKLAVTASNIHDCLQVFEALGKATKPAIILAMGEAGVITRLLAGRYGGWLTYAAADGAGEVAPGQVALSDMLGLYRVRAVTAATALYGVVANPVGHSMSPAVHNSAFRAYGLDAIYLPLLVPDVGPFLDQFTRLGFGGFSVTIPHKAAVIPHLSEVDPLARRIGAVNTILAKDGRLLGSNTDVEGALASIKAALPLGRRLEEMTTLLIGAGGLARALAFGLRDGGVSLLIANRNLARARELAAEVGAEAIPLEEIEGQRPDLLLQTTSVGMHPNVDETIVPANMLRRGMLVYDAVYNPLETRLLREARLAGCVTISGLGHFVAQAARQFELWTGLDAPVEVMRQSVLERLGH